MEKIDQGMAQRVWQRVQSAPPPAPDPAALAALISGELTDANTCLGLYRQLGGKGGTLLTLAREDQAHAGCLRGICSLAMGKIPETAALSPRSEQPQAALRKCYVNHLARIREYEARSADPSFGPAFQKLAQEERSHCTALLSLLGTLGNH